MFDSIQLLYLLIKLEVRFAMLSAHLEAEVPLDLHLHLDGLPLLLEELKAFALLDFVVLLFHFLSSSAAHLD